jgi:alkyl sulfatase BDS1-like metallo-beta-lactamase superfamily hydrolase
VRCFGGWYSGVPSELKPAPRQALAREVLSLSGGSAKVPSSGRARCSPAGDAHSRRTLRTGPWTPSRRAAKVHALRAAVYKKLLESSTSTMSKGIYGAAARESAERAKKS